MKQLIFIFLSILLISSSSIYKPLYMQGKLNPAIELYLQAAEKEFAAIPDERKRQLKDISLFISEKLATEKKAALVFICTHNSRRSHMSQIWATAAAEYYGIKGISSFSGGTEVSAFNPRAIKALTAAGFVITKKTDGINPTYEVEFSNNAKPIIAFSKKYIDASNPTSNFAAIMTCSHADENCPIVYGASVKIAIPYQDPKEADGKSNETEIYAERCKQIATEMLYVFWLVHANGAD